eukprot:1378666-Amphidinium_carterae.1
MHTIVFSVRLGSRKSGSPRGTPDINFCEDLAQWWQIHLSQHLHSEKSGRHLAKPPPSLQNSKFTQKTKRKCRNTLARMTLHDYAFKRHCGSSAQDGKQE